MLRTIRSAACLLVASVLVTAACGASKPPKQVEAPDALSDKGADMSSGQDSSGNVKAPEGKSGEEQMHERCCGECKTGMSKDRTGAAASSIPCSDFTDTLSPVCLEHFRAKKTMASECK